MKSIVMTSREKINLYICYLLMIHIPSFLYFQQNNETITIIFSFIVLYVHVNLILIIFVPSFSIFSKITK